VEASRLDLLCTVFSLIFDCNDLNWRDNTLLVRPLRVDSRTNSSASVINTILFLCNIFGISVLGASNLAFAISATILSLRWIVFPTDV